MEHLVIAAYVLCGAAGVAGFGALAVVRLRHSGTFVPRFLVLYSMFQAALAAVMVRYYAGNVVDLAGTVTADLRAALAVVAGICAWLSLAALAETIRRTTPRKRWFGRWLRRAAMMLCWLTVLAQVTGQAASSLGAGWQLPFAPWLGYLLSTAAVCLGGGALILADWRDEPEPVAWFGRGAGLVCLSYAPLTGVELMLNNLAPRAVGPIAVEFLLSFAFAAVACLAALRSLRASAGIPRARRLAVIDGIDDATVAAWGLTARESEIAELIAEGLSNRQIGERLGISAATVRTHVYNLFRKVGASNRIELLNRLGG